MTLNDARKLKKKEIFVPNCSARAAIEILLFLQGKRKKFPEYNDHSLLIVGIIDEEVWMTPKEYRESYCPPDMICISRD